MFHKLKVSNSASLVLKLQQWSTGITIVDQCPKPELSRGSCFFESITPVQVLKPRICPDQALLFERCVGCSEISDVDANVDASGTSGLCLGYSTGGEN